MGQKVNPHGLRVGVIDNWDSRWFVSDETFGDTLVSDYNLRKKLKEKLQGAGVPKIEIERDSQRVRVFIHCAKPGVIIGRGGTEIDKLKTDIEAIVKKPVAVNVVEVKQPDLNAQLVAESIALQLEKRTSFRRAMKQAIGRTMRLGAKGIKIQCGGRLGGAEIARTEHYHEGTIPLQTLRADIDYGFWEANTTYGKIGIKVWIYRGEVLNEVNRPSGARQRTENRFENKGERKPYGDRRGGFGGNRQGGGYNNGNRQGGYNSGNRQGGGYNSGNRQGGGYNSGNRQGGGYNSGNRQGGYNNGNRQNAAPATFRPNTNVLRPNTNTKPATAAPAAKPADSTTKTEGGTN